MEKGSAVPNECPISEICRNILNKPPWDRSQYLAQNQRLIQQIGEELAKPDSNKVLQCGVTNERNCASYIAIKREDPTHRDNETPTV